MSKELWKYFTNLSVIQQFLDFTRYEISTVILPHSVSISTMYSLFKSSKGLLLQKFCQTCLVLLMNSGVKVTCPKYTVSSSKKSWKKNVYKKSNQRLSVNFIIWTYRFRQIFVAEIIYLIKIVILFFINSKKEIF